MALRTAELRAIAAARLEDARSLFDAVELALKARICDTLDWSGYPSIDCEADAV